jgi:hypothetical protein
MPAAVGIAAVGMAAGAMDEDAFAEWSNGCLNRVVDHIGSLEGKADVRRFSDVYQHLLKLQRVALQSGDAATRERFAVEYGVCAPVVEPGATLSGDTAADKPTEQQLDEFRKTVRAWFTLDDEERELRKRAGERRMLKGRLTVDILDFMARFRIEDLKTGQGVLRSFRREVAKQPTRAVATRRLYEFFTDRPEVADSLALTVFQATTEERVGLRRLRAPPS